jgi:hypothetical protein
MKTGKQKILTIVSLVALVFAAVNFYAPNQAYARAGNQKKVNTWCPISEVSCNNCTDGNEDCTDRTCAECKKYVIIQ